MSDPVPCTHGQSLPCDVCRFLADHDKYQRLGDLLPLRPPVIVGVDWGSGPHAKKYRTPNQMKALRKKRRSKG